MFGSTGTSWNRNPPITGLTLLSFLLIWYSTSFSRKYIHLVKLVHCWPKNSSQLLFLSQNLLYHKRSFAAYLIDVSHQIYPSHTTFTWLASSTPCFNISYVLTSGMLAYVTRFFLSFRILWCCSMLLLVFFWFCADCGFD